jgi:TetR/AcrR family transcriptional regulator, transcriptional repressor for nem operon
MPRNKAFQEDNALEKAMHVFWKKGYNATSMEDLVTAMGINRASLYDTFGDKKQLYMAALRQFQSDSQSQNSKILTQKSLSPKAQLTAILENQLEQSLQDAEQKGCMIANATAEMALLDNEVCQFVTQNKCAVEALFEKLIEDGQAKGEFYPQITPQYGAAFLVNFLNGMRVVSKTKPDEQTMRESLALALSVLG